MADSEQAAKKIQFSSPPSIIFVDGGNQGRSLSCELIARAHCPTFEIISAGIHTKEGGESPDPQLVNLMGAKEIKCDDYKSKKLTGEMLDNADLILTVSTSYLDEVIKLFSDHEFKNCQIGEKIFRVSNWSENPSEMPDPVIMAEKFYALFLKNVEDSILSAFIHFGLLDERPQAIFDPKSPISKSRLDVENTNPHIIREVLTSKEIVELLEYSRNVFTTERDAKTEEREKDLEENPTWNIFPDQQEDSDEFEWGNHLAVFLHKDGGFEKAMPRLRKKLLSAIENADDYHVLKGKEWNVRCIEYHRYTEGGSLLQEDHVDAGSLLTMSLLLSEPDEFEGGEFATFDSNNSRVVHENLGKGDALVFVSEKRHNVLEITSGVREAFVIELWPNARNIKDRFT